MKTAVIVLICLVFFSGAKGQKAVYDAKHYQSVVTNAGVRSAAEQTHQQYLGRINTDIDNLNTNAGAVVLAQDMIYRGLSNVNSALKDGLEVKYMATVTADIISFIGQCAELAKDDPFLLVFANNIGTEMRRRSLALVSEVSGFVLKEGDNVLADYNARDQLLHNIVTQLQIIDGLAYGAWRAMFWAKQEGLIKTLNPFRDFINHDRDYAGRIILNAKYLSK
jgi:hypothetical protein